MSVSAFPSKESRYIVTCNSHSLPCLPIPRLFNFIPPFGNISVFKDQELGKGAYQPGDLSLIPRNRAKMNGENWLHKVVLSDWNPLSSKDVRKWRMSFHQQKVGLWSETSCLAGFDPSVLNVSPWLLYLSLFFAKKQNYSTWCYCPTLYWCHYHISLC